MTDRHPAGVGRPAACRRTVRAVTVLVAVGVLALAATACGAGRRSAPAPTGSVAALPVGSSARTLTVDGRERGYRLYRPSGVSLAEPVPLVVMLHGALGTGSQAESAYGWNAQADRGRFLVVYPDGLNRAWAVSEGCCGQPAKDGVNDVAFISQLVTNLSAELPIDPARVFVTGISNGGMLTYRLACDTTLFAAIGPVAATMLGTCPSPAPTSVIHIHGTADQTVPYTGGPGKRDNGGQGRNPVRIDGPPVPKLIDRWRTLANCVPPSVGTVEPVTRSVSTCPDGREVELVSVAGAGHQWPGSAAPERAVQRLLQLDPPSTALNATETIWRFFSSHPKPA